MDAADNNPQWGTPDRKQAALLTQYQEVREEIRLEIESQSRRLTRGIAAVGLVAGYGLVADELVYLSFVPAIIAFVFLLTMMGNVSVLLLGWHAAEIEAELPYESFSWERRYGEVFPENRRARIDPWGKVPAMAVVAVGIVTYLMFILLGCWFVQRANYGRVAGVQALVVLLSVYFVLTLLAGIAAYAYFRTRTKIRNRLQ